MAEKLLFPILFTFLLISLNSCQHEIKLTQTFEDDKKAVIDSTILAFEKTLIKNQVDSVLKKHQFNGSVAIFKDSVELYRKNQGFSDFKEKIKMDSNTIFAIGSVSKQFTAVLTLLQMEQGKLTITDKVSKYLKEFQTKEYENITIHQLLNHTSGLNMMGGKLMFKSGSDFFYSNDGFNMLGKIVEKVSEKSYHENLQELFRKAGMVDSSTGDVFKGHNFANAYLGTPNKFEEVPNMPKRLSGKEIGTPAGGILSTIRDLHSWNNALYSGKILKSETLKLFISQSAERHHPIFGKMGYAYGIMLNIGQPNSYFHSGYVKGSPSLNIYYPDTKTSVIILSNIADEGKGKDLIFRPHTEVKMITDHLENTLTQLRSKH